MKNIYEEFNNIDIDLSKYKNIDMTEDEILKYKKYFFKKENSKEKNNKALIAALILGVIGVTLFTNYNQINASINEISESIKSYFIKEINRDVSSYIENINSEVTDKNITIKLNEVLIDDNEIVINRTIDYSKLTENDGEIFDHINEIKKSDNIGEILVNSVKLKQGYSIQNIIDNNTYNWISVYILDNIDINNNQEISIENEFSYTTPTKEHDENFGIVKRIEGDWSFNFNINSKNIYETVRKVDINKDNYMELPNGDILTVTEISKSDISIKINYEILTNEEDDYYNANRIYVVNSKDEKLSDGIRGYRDKKGYIQYFLNDPDEDNFIIKCVGSDKIIEVEF